VEALLPKRESAPCLIEGKVTEQPAGRDFIRDWPRIRLYLGKPLGHKSEICPQFLRGNLVFCSQGRPGKKTSSNP
jgi:hypothetical protein